MQQVIIRNQTHPYGPSIQASYCNTFWSRLKGRMFTSQVGLEEGSLLVQPVETRTEAAIHMFFVPYDLGVIWINKAGRVVDQCIAKAWRPFYIPARPAQYILEIHPQHLSEFHLNDQVFFDHA